jgi:hypothetical protein
MIVRVAKSRKRGSFTKRNMAATAYCHHIDSFEVAADLTTVNALWLKTNSDHFVYRLGPPMAPLTEVRTVTFSRTVACIAQSTPCCQEHSRLSATREMKQSAVCNDPTCHFPRVGNE